MIRYLRLLQREMPTTFDEHKIYFSSLSAFLDDCKIALPTCISNNTAKNIAADVVPAVRVLACDVAVDQARSSKHEQS